jgi:sn-glycerol 3-phosphate transport system substrate-binding protein
MEMWVNVALKQQASPTAPPAAWQGLRGGAFANAYTAMAFLGAPELSGLIRDATGFRWTTVQMPRKTKQGSHFYSGATFVIRGSRQKDAAGEFVRFMALPDSLVQLNSITLGMITRKSAAARKEWQEKLKSEPRMQAFNDSTAYQRAYPVLPGWNEASNGTEGIGQALLDAVQGKASPRAALEEGARRAQAYLATQGG